MASLGEQLKVLRIKKGMTQEQLAQKLNTTKAAISRYEKDQRQPRLEQISEIAKILDASPDDLYYLFLGSSELRDKKGDYASHMNVTAKWVETITGANGTINPVDDRKTAGNPEISTIVYSQMDATSEVANQLVSILTDMPPASYPAFSDALARLVEEFQNNPNATYEQLIQTAYEEGFQFGFKMAQKINDSRDSDE